MSVLWKKVWVVCMILVSAEMIGGVAFAQSADVEKQMKELEQVIEMMRAQGADQAQVDQFEAMMRVQIQQDAELRAERSRGESQKAANMAADKAQVKIAAAKTLPPPELEAGELVIVVSGESSVFDVAYCNYQEYRTGNLVVEFDVSATGSFRGRPAIVFLSRSRPAEFAGEFHDFDLFLGEMTDEQRELPPLVVKQQWTQEQAVFEQQEQAAVEAKYSDVDFDAIPIEEAIKVADEQSNEMREARERAHAKTFPIARANDVEIGVDGNTAHANASGFDTSDADRAPEFRNLDGATEAWVNCE